MDITMQRIISELETQGKNQTQLANFLGVTSNVITDWKSGRIKSYSKYLHGIADFLDVSVEYLKGKTDIKKAPKTSVSDDEIKFALWGDVADEIPDEKLQEVKNFADYIKSTYVKDNN